jgi:hypothetical protein
MFDSLIMITEYTFSTFVPIEFYKVDFDKDYLSTKISRKCFCLNHNFFVIIDLEFWLDHHSIRARTIVESVVGYKPVSCHL